MRLSVTGFIAVAVLVWATSACAQTAATPLSFEVASVKVAHDPTQTKDDYTNGYNAGMRAGLASLGLRVVGQRAMVTDATLKDLIRMAYQVKDFQIVGPASIASVKFDIEAKMPDGSQRSQAPAMLQTLLAQRFHLELHRETRPLPVYALVAAKGGHKLTTATPQVQASHVGEFQPGMRFAPVTLDSLADKLSKYTDRPIVDKSGIDGKFDVRLVFVSDPGMPETESIPSLPVALQRQVGLQLEKRTLDVEVLVIDKADRLPIEN